MPIILRPRHVAAWAVASCTEVTLDVAVHYAAPPARQASPVQRRIEAAVQLPNPAEQGWLGDVECWFHDGERLSSVGLYGNFAAAELTRIAAPDRAAPVWLDASGLAGEGGPVGRSAIAIDRAGRAVRLRQSGRGGVAWFSPAEGLSIGLDEAGLFAELVVTGVQWGSTDPV